MWRSCPGTEAASESGFRHGHAAEILILDEPTSQLDPHRRFGFPEHRRKINLELGTTVLISEHRLEDILPAADRAVVMEQGRTGGGRRPPGASDGFYLNRITPMFAAMPAPVRTFFAVGGSGCPLTVREGQWLKMPSRSRCVSRNCRKSWHSTARPAALTIRKPGSAKKDTPDILRGWTCPSRRGAFCHRRRKRRGKIHPLKSVCGICRPYRGKNRRIREKCRKIQKRVPFDRCLAMLPQDPVSVRG